MTKYEACHRLADINEAIYDIQNIISDVESRLRWDDSDKRNYYEGQLQKLKDELLDLEHEHDEFLKEYGYIIYS